MLQMSLSQSQYFSSKLGKDVKRGLDKKIQVGHRPGVAPEGYLNDSTKGKGLNTIIKDPKRFKLLRKSIDLMLTGNYTAVEVLNILNNEWGYRTVKRKKRGGGPMARTCFYYLLSNPFYTGINVFKGEETKGKQPPLLTTDEFNQIQKY